jgi:PAS domain S-box-containing protein
MANEPLQQKATNGNLLGSVAVATQTLLTSSNHEPPFVRALEAVGLALEVDRICVFETQSPAHADNPLVSMRFEWSREPAAAAASPGLQNLSLKDSLPRWHAALSAGEPIAGHARDLPPEERAFLEPLGIRSLLVIPILLQEQGLAFVCFHQCRSEREGAGGEKAVLQTLAASLGGAISRRNSEQALRASERQLRTIVDKLPVGVWLTDAGGRIILCNQAGERIWGGSRPSTIDQCGQYVGWWHGTGRRIEPHEWAPVRAISRGETYVNEVIDIESPDGQRQTISHSAMPVRDDAGRIAGIVVINEDITERTRAQVRLRESEERHRRTTQALSDYVYTVWVKDGRVESTEHGAACEAVTGYTRDDFASNPYLWLRMVVEDDRSAVLEQGRRILAGEPAAPIEHRILHKDGQMRWVRNTPVPHRDPQGKLLYYDGVIQDITDRRQAEEILRLSQFAMDHCAIPVLWIGPQGRFIYVNEAAAKSLGYPREQLVYLGVPDIAPDLPVADWPTHWAELKQKKTLRLESRFRAQDGRIFPVEISSNYMEFNGKEYDFAFAADISGRKQAEESLKFTQFAVDHCSIPAYWIDPDASILYANEAAALLSGYPREELQKMKVTDLAPRWTPESWKGFWAQLRERRAFVMESCQRAKDGRIFPTEVASSHLEYAGKERCFAFVQDITLRKSSEEAQGS